MSPRIKMAAAAGVAVIAAVAFTAFSFRREVASIHRRQGAMAAQCVQLVREARELIGQGRAMDAEQGDYCRAHDLIDRAVSAMQRAQTTCRQALDQDPMTTSNAAIARMSASRAELAAKCSQKP